MKKFLLVLLPLALQAQTIFVAQKTTSLSGAAEVITVQQPTTGAKFVEFKSAYVDCSVACTITLERNGNPASSTALTPANVNPGETAAVAKAWHTSNVGTGTTIEVVTLTAGDYVVFDLTGINLPASNNPGSNFTVRLSSITGSVNIRIKWTER